MKRLLSIRPFLALLVLAGSLFAHATTYREMDLQELVDAAELAFHGMVTDVTVRLEDGDPWTFVTFDVLELLHSGTDAVDGSGDGEGSITLAFLGGETGGIRLSVALMPEFEEAGEVLVLAHGGRHYSPVTGFRQGLWRLSPAGTWLDEDGSPFPLPEGTEDDGDAGAAVAALRRLFGERR